MICPIKHNRKLLAAKYLIQAPKHNKKHAKFKDFENDFVSKIDP